MQRITWQYVFGLWNIGIKFIFSFDCSKVEVLYFIGYHCACWTWTKRVLTESLLWGTSWIVSYYLLLKLVKFVLLYICLILWLWQGWKWLIHTTSCLSFKVGWHLGFWEKYWLVKNVEEWSWWLGIWK